ncbi:hypothetical protein SUDANB95_03323 [Actinosynnema sp. ALI-1.44]
MGDSATAGPIGEMSALRRRTRRVGHGYRFPRIASVVPGAVPVVMRLSRSGGATSRRRRVPIGSGVAGMVVVLAAAVLAGTAYPGTIFYRLGWWIGPQETNLLFDGEDVVLPCAVLIIGGVVALTGHRWANGRAAG